MPIATPPFRPRAASRLGILAGAVLLASCSPASQQSSGTLAPISTLAPSAVSSAASGSTGPGTGAVSTSAGPTVPGATPSGQPGAAKALPSFAHVYVLVLENKEFDSIVGASDAPYLNGLIERYGLATA